MLAGIYKIKLVPCSDYMPEQDNYIQIPFTPESAFLKIKRKDTAEGNISSVSMDCFVLCADFDNLNLANVLNDTLVVSAIDNDDANYQFGDNACGLKCSFHYTTGKKPGEGKGYKLKFTGKIC